MRRKSLLFLLAAFVFAVVQHDEAFAQKNKYRNKANDPVKELGYEKKLRWADGLFRSGSYYNATDYYLDLIQEQPRNPYLVYQLAECYWAMRDYVPAAKYFGYAYELASALYPEAIYKEAQMLKMQGEYDKAIVRFNKFIADNPKTFKKLKKSALREIEGCEMGKSSLNDARNATVKNVGPNVNTAYTELSPYPLGDTAILFATMKSNSEVEVGKEKRADYVSRFMVSRKQKYTDVVDTFEWALPFMDGKFNDPKFHVGNGSFSPGGDRFYFTRCLENESNEMTCRIYVSNFEGDKWGNPIEIPNGVNPEGDGSSSTQPFVAKIGKKEILFFSSNRKLQSRGKYDIWYSVYDPRQKSYRRPQNAGKQINTEGDEKSPYYDSRINRLYFASDGWKSMGGLDIFSADGGPSRYTNLQNLGAPINTSYDDLYFISDPVGKPDAYIVSNRPGSIALKNPTCCDDIWRVQFEPKIMAVGKVLNQKTQQPVGNAVVKMVDEAGNIKTFNSEDGNFEFSAERGHSYVLNADKQDFISTRATFNTEGMKREDPDKTITLTIYVDSVALNVDFRMENVFYDYDKASLKPESGAELEKLITLMKDNPSVDVEIGAHTDGKGDDAYNMNLSQQRAEAVVQYLISSGIERSRLTAKGYGETKPVAPNTVNGKDSEENRAKNRRTEFRIMADVPSRRMVFDSSKPGTIGQQEKNLTVTEEQSDNVEATDSESEFGRPGSRVRGE